MSPSRALRTPTSYGIDRSLRLGFFLAASLSIYANSAAALEDEVPFANRPSSNFFGAQGSSVKAVWTLDRESVPEGGELTATLTILGAANPRQILRPDLKKLQEFQSRFAIVDKADPAPTEVSKEVKFSYSLRPRNRSVDKVPGLEFYFYNPTAAAGKKQFPLTTARALPIAVVEATVPEPPIIPLGEPDHLFALAIGPQLLEKPLLEPGYWLWMSLGLAGPAFALGWYLAWQRIYPDAARAAKLRRSRAARQAILAIRRSARADEPAAAMARAVLGYLRSRFSIPPPAVTPSEIEGALRVGLEGSSESSAVAEFFRACDAARFSQLGGRASLLAEDAEELIVRLEAE